MLKFNKMFVLMFLTYFFTIQVSHASVEEFFGIGAELIKDPYNKKLIVVKILPNTPASKSGLRVADEITAIDNEGVRKLNICEAISKIRGKENTVVKLKIKKGIFKREVIELTRGKITITYNDMTEYDKYWYQTAPRCHSNPKPFPEEVVKKLSCKYKKTILAASDYWLERKKMFKRGYDSCQDFSTKSNKELCLIHLLDRESAKTNADKALYKFLQ